MDGPYLPARCACFQSGLAEIFPRFSVPPLLPFPCLSSPCSLRSQLDLFECYFTFQVTVIYIKHEFGCISGDPMEEASVGSTYQFGDRTTSDITVCLRSRDVAPGLFFCHSSILKKKSRFFAEQLSSGITEPNNHIEVHCQGSESDHFVKLLKLLYLPEDLVLDSWDSVKNTLGVLRASITLQCEEISQSCIQYLEAVSWDEKEEEEILKIVPNLGPEATPILARIQPVNLTATKNIFLAAIRFATAIDRSVPMFEDELKTSAQEQLEYMLAEDEDTPLITGDEEVKSAVRTGLAKLFTTFENDVNALPLDFVQSPEEAEQRVLQSLSDVEWICSILPKMEMMKDFVSSWATISGHVLTVVQDEKFSSSLWGVKVRLIEVAGKALDVVGYGSVVLPSPQRLQLLKIWLPYMRKMKPTLDSMSELDDCFPYKMDSDMCQNLEGAMVSLILALPSNDQAEILGDWMKATEQLKFPDLSEAFEVWCYRTKTAKRRLMVDLNGHTVSL